MVPGQIDVTICLMASTGKPWWTPSEDGVDKNTDGYESDHEYPAGFGGHLVLVSAGFSANTRDWLFRIARPAKSGSAGYPPVSL